MKTMIQAAAVTLIAASVAHAQQAVQWRVEDGGNGHWYQWKVQPSGISWTVAREVCIGRGGHLATPTVPGENQFIFNLTLPTSAWRNRFGPWLGGYQEFSASDYSEPAGGWRWVTGEQWAWTAWWRGEPTNFYCASPGEDKLHFIDYEPKWNDITNEAGDCEGANWSFLIEWSADCNNDGIVDYGQCHDGTLADYNGNNIPDCCERGEVCVVGNYPVQWRVENGGSGHWYQRIEAANFVSWHEAKSDAESWGGYLACPTTAPENAWIWSNLVRDFSRGWDGWIGLYQAVGPEPSGGWRWVSGEPMAFTSWCGNQPDDSNGLEDYGHYMTIHGPGCWNDIRIDGSYSGARYILDFLVEWSADCNSDGIVDYGQILQGQLADANADGIPDICQAPTCVDADLFRDFNVDGADLGILLAQWGPSTPLTVSDINDDGIVSGADLGLLLSFWGVCPN